MDNAIARTALFGQLPGEARFEITVEIGAPYKCGESPEEWACPVALRPLHGKLPDAHGNDGFQALCLAIGHVQNLLRRFREEGGALTYDSGEPFPLEAYAFGGRG